MPIHCKNPDDCSVNLSHQLARNQSNWHNALVRAHKMSDEITFSFCAMTLHAEEIINDYYLFCIQT